MMTRCSAPVPLVPPVRTNPLVPAFCWQPCGNLHFGNRAFRWIPQWIPDLDTALWGVTTPCNLPLQPAISCVPGFCVPAIFCAPTFRTIGLCTNHGTNQAALTCLFVATTLATALLLAVRLGAGPARFRSSQPAHALESGQQIAKEVFDGLGVGSIVQPQVLRNTATAGTRVVPGVVQTGVTGHGKVYLFAGGMGNDLTAFKTVFHECFL